MHHEGTKIAKKSMILHSHLFCLFHSAFAFMDEKDAGRVGSAAGNIP